MVASVTGQAVGSGLSALADKGIGNVTSSDIKVDAATTAGNVAGAVAEGGVVGLSEKAAPTITDEVKNNL